MSCWMPRSRQGRKREHSSLNFTLTTSVSSSQSQTEKQILPFVLKTADEKLKLKGSYNAHFPQVDIILLGS